MKQKDKDIWYKGKCYDIQRIGPEIPIISNEYLGNWIKIKILQWPKNRKANVCAEGCLKYWN